MSSQEAETILPWRELGFFSLGRCKRLPQDAQGKPVILVQVITVQPSHYCLPGFFCCDAVVIYDGIPCSTMPWLTFLDGTVKFVGVC